MGPKWTAQEESVISANFHGITIRQLSALLPGRTPRAVNHKAKELGLSKSPQETGLVKSARWRADFEARLDEPICAWLRRRYIDERATYRELCAETGINNRSVMRLMAQCQVEPISAATAARREMEANHAFLEPMLKAARTDKAAHARAMRRQQDWERRCSGNELRFLDVLRDVGLNPVPQLAIESFNIDFAFPADMLAVELDPRWHRSKIKCPIDKRKDLLLQSLGWIVLRLDDRTSDGANVRKISDALTSLAATQPR